MNPTEAEGISETAPLNSQSRASNYFPVEATGKTVSSTYFLVVILIAAIIPIIQVSVGAAYNGDCPIEQRIATYMIVAGAVGLVMVAFALLLVLTFRCLISDSTTVTVLATLGICFLSFFTILLAIFAFIWFIIGCVWVFSINDDVQFKDPSKHDYCEPGLYKTAFVLLILTIVLFFIQCCVSCFRACCVGGSG